MKNTLQRICIAFSLVAMLGTLNAQRECSMQEHMQDLLSNPDYALAHQKRQLKFEAVQTQNQSKSALCPNPVTLPIAIHYQGIGSPNAACLIAQAQNQIDILNNDYQGTNTEIASLWTGGASTFFPGVSNGETCVEFCLATNSHPAGYGLTEGQPAVTINTTSGDFDSNWSGYINVWVRDIGGLGYSPLGGSGNGDGVVVDVNAFGSGPGCSGVVPGVPYHLGRTLTHELGHYMNLDHIWGGGCGNDDGVADTPDSQGSYFGCPANGVASCGSTDMHMSYMDYSDDPCMYMFSDGQSGRMENWVSSNLGNVAANAASTCSPPAPHCSNGVQDADETGVDCGGADCAPCPCPSFTIYLPSTVTGPALIVCDTDPAPSGYVAAGNQACAQQVVNDDPFCLDTEWDGLCQDAYDLCVGTDVCGVFATAPVDLTKSFQPVPFPNGDVDRVQLKFYKSSPEVSYSAADDAALDIEFWPIRDLSTNTPIVNGPVTLLADKTKPGQNFFKWPVKFIRPDIDPNIRYAWRLRVKCQAGDLTVSPWSAQKIFNTPDFDPVTGIYTPPAGAFSENEVKSIFSSEIVLMPNPASGSIRITNADGLPESFDWYVMDMTGRVVFNGAVRGSKSDFLLLDLNGMAQGSYQLLMVAEQFSTSAPFLIRR